MKKMSTAILSTCAVALLATAGVAPSMAHEKGAEHKSGGKGQDKTVMLSATLTQLNDSGVSGSATAVVRNQLIRSIEVTASGLTPDGPHAQHIHYGDDARNECPTLALDDTPPVRRPSQHRGGPTRLRSHPGVTDHDG